MLLSAGGTAQAAPLGQFGVESVEHGEEEPAGMPRSRAPQSWGRSCRVIHSGSDWSLLPVVEYAWSSMRSHGLS